MSKSENLTAQQERFCREYLVDLNGTQAAIRAGYSEKTACEQASRLLANVKVREFAQQLMNERAVRVEVTADVVLRELLRIAMVDLAGAYNEDGSLKDVKDMPEEIRRAIAGIDVTTEWTEIDGEQRPTGQTKKVKFWDKPRALELLGRHLKLFTDKLEMSGKLTLEELVAGSQKTEEPK